MKTKHDQRTRRLVQAGQRTRECCAIGEQVRRQRRVVDGLRGFDFRTHGIRAPPLTSKVIDTTMTRDREQPRPRRRFTTELAETRERFMKRVLGKVLGRCVIAHQRAAQTVDVTREGLHQPSRSLSAITCR